MDKHYAETQIPPDTLDRHPFRCYRHHPDHHPTGQLQPDSQTISHLGLKVGEIPVGGLNYEEAAERIYTVYRSPIGTYLRRFSNSDPSSRSGF